MRQYGYLRTACAVPKVSVADCRANSEAIIRLCQKAWEEKAAVVLFPELCVTGYTCGDLFFQRQLQESVREAVNAIKDWSNGHPMLIIIGVPVPMTSGLYNCALAINDGRLLGLVPKQAVPNNQEFYEKRWFKSANDLDTDSCDWFGEAIPIGSDLLFQHASIPEAIVGIEICEDLWTPMPPSAALAVRGATILLNPSASNDLIAKADYRDTLIANQSGRCNAAYLYASAGFGESTTDVVFGGAALIYERGTLLECGKRFVKDEQHIVADVDIEALVHDRQIQTSFSEMAASLPKCRTIYFDAIDCQDETLKRSVNAHPFVPKDAAQRNARCEEIFNIQTMGLGSRVMHIGSPAMVVGISGGLDSTLALLVCVNVCDTFGIDRKQIHAVTMPGFGTTDRTYYNAVALIQGLGATYHEIPIRDAASGHLEDIGHDLSVHDVTYENAQARERTQILMDLANRFNGIVVGTGDLSELALGWATYNGDHMSMYGVNAGIPKTLVRYLVRYVADQHQDRNVADVLYDVLDTPVSPELLPPDEAGQIAQKTEDLVGPYELHDFFMYHVLRNGFAPEKIYYLSQQAFNGVYDKKTLYQWLRNFYWRFFTQQFKRSCLPDGPKVGNVSLSPRGDWRMPSDAKVRLWMDAMDKIAKEEEERGW